MYINLKLYIELRCHKEETFGAHYLVTQDTICDYGQMIIKGSVLKYKFVVSKMFWHVHCNQVMCYLKLIFISCRGNKYVLAYTGIIGGLNVFFFFSAG